MQARGKMLSLIILMVAFAIAGLSAFAQPLGPSGIVQGPSERRPAAAGTIVQAQAGNVTALVINATRITRRWQGYYGNVTGRISLDDAYNNTLYNWELADPQGEIYASNGSSVNWDNIRCVNFTADESSGDAQKYNLSRLNNFIGLGSGDEQAEADSINATFNQTFGDDGNSFQVGTTTISNSNNCSMVALFGDTGYQTSNFQEVILTDNTSIIFTTLLEQDAAGFQGSNLDFQMIVGVNGTSTAPGADVRNYYFYVELT